MKKIICKNYEEVSRMAAFVFAEQLWRKPASVLGFCTGGTPNGMYNCLVDMYNGGNVDFSEAVTFNIDEFHPISKTNSKSCDYTMWDRLFSKINIRRENVFLPNGGAQDPQRACDEYERLIALHGGIDLMLLGIGKNGHVAFNEPASEMVIRTHINELKDNTIESYTDHFGGRENVPPKALTMGIGSIMNAKRILMLITGDKKAAIVKKMFSGVVTPEVPASFLQLHSNVIVFLDRAAASEL